jgi:tRNA-specific 2-thiouridylase
VRELARQLGLPTAERAESQDVCFIRDGDYRRFIQERLPDAVHPGPIYDAAGHLLGEHRGLPFYTVGQRQGLGISAPQPLYVLRLEPDRNALVVGTADELGATALEAEAMRYVAGKAPAAAIDVEAKIRYRAHRQAARVHPLPDGRSRVIFEQPLRDITPGQAVVLYQGQAVIGGGVIVRPIAKTTGTA